MNKIIIPFFIILSPCLAANTCIYDIVRTANIKNISENQHFSVQLFVLLLVQSTNWELLNRWAFYRVQVTSYRVYEKLFFSYRLHCR
jgi:hypothetical protein